MTGMLLAALAHATPPDGVYAALDAVAVGGGAALGEALFGQVFAEDQVSFGFGGAPSCPLDLVGRPRPCRDGLAVALWLGAGGLGGASLAALPVRVRPWKVALGSAIPSSIGVGLALAGELTGDEALMRAGVGTIAFGTPLATAIAAATEPQGAPEPALAVGVAPAAGGGRLAVTGRF